MPRDAVSRTVNVERTGRHKWVKVRKLPRSPANLLKDLFFPDNGCIFRAVKIFKLEDIHRAYDSIHMHKTMKINNNEYIRGSIDLEYPVHPYSPRNRHLLQAPFLVSML